MHPQRQIQPLTSPRYKPTHAEGTLPCTLGMFYHHSASPKGRRPASRAHSHTPSEADSIASTAPKAPNPRPRHTPIHPDTKYHNSTRCSTQPLPKVQPNAPSGASTPHNAALTQAILTEGTPPYTLGMIYRHPTSPNGTHPTTKVHASTPSGVNSTANTTQTAPNPRPRCTTMHPRQQISLLPPPQHRPIPIGGTQSALSAEITSTNTTQTAPNPHRRHTPAHPRRRLSCRRGKTIISRPGAPLHSTESTAHPRHTGLPHTLRRTDRAHCTDQPYISACKRALHCAMCTVKRPETLGAVRATTRHGELDKEFSQSPTTAEPQSRQRPAQPEPGPGPTAASPRPLHPDRNRRRSRHAARPRSEPGPRSADRGRRRPSGRR